jgi:UDP-N-acetylglucosamine 2-epimerase
VDNHSVLRTILSVVGTRPELIQAAPVSRALAGRCREVVLHTGQHYSAGLSGALIDELQMRVDRWLEVGSGSHADQTARTLLGVETAIIEERPDAVLVRGDTNSTLGAALAAAKMGVPIVHTEAGARSFDRTMPEELNRLVVDRIATVLCCSSDQGVANLAAEGIKSGVRVTGDVTVDAVCANAPSESDAAAMAAELGLRRDAFALATLHRAANTDDPARLRGILSGLGRVGVPVLLALHPRTAAAMSREGITAPPSVRVVEPLAYRTMLALLSLARVLLTDSGGLQKEAYVLGTPCVTLRDSTEWTETITAGWNRLAGADPDSIASLGRDFARPSSRPPLYGDGHAASRIADAALDA